jgi:hypothetical protein
MNRETLGAATARWRRGWWIGASAWLMACFATWPSKGTKKDMCLVSLLRVEHLVLVLFKT